MAGGGCDSIRNVARDMRLPFMARGGEPLAVLEPRPYPHDAKVAGGLDIEVIRDGNAIILDNRTTRTFENVPMWLNQEYGGTVGDVPAGRGTPLKLTSFVNHYGEPYPVAKFLQPELDRSLILAELYLDGRLHKLTVRLDDRWRQP